MSREIPTFIQLEDTWNYPPQVPSRDPPPILIPPQPPPPPQGAVSIEDEEYMSIDPDGPHFDPTLVLSQTSSTKARRFVGGFVNGLRRFPKAIRSGTRLQRKQERHDTDDTEVPTDTLVPPRNSTTDYAGPSNIVQYVEAVEMPVEAPAIPPPSHISHHPPPSTPSAIHSSVPVSRVHSQQVSTSHEPVEVPTIPTPSHVSHHSHHPTHSAFPSSAPVSRVHSQQASASHGGAAALPGGEFHHPTTVEVGESTTTSPVLVEPLRAFDYAKMNPHRTSVRSQVFNLHRFFRDLKDLPWISNRITTDYVPGDTRNDRRKKYVKPSSSWYKDPHRQSLDLLSSGSSSTSSPPRSTYSRPMTTTTSHSYPPADNSHNRRAPRHHHRRPRSHSHDIPRPPPPHSHNCPVYPFHFPPYSYSPQPLFVMQPPASRSASPQRESDQPQAGGFPDIRQAVPIYMVSPTSPNPLVVPEAGKHHHHPHIHPYPISVPGHPQPQPT